MTSEQNGYLYRWTGGEPPDLAYIGRELEQAGLLPREERWWFGWSELTIQLPGRLLDLNAIDTTLDVVHLFSPQVELRWILRGGRRQVALLTENLLPTTLMNWQRQRTEGSYRVRATRRILWGNRLRLPGDTVRGVVQFPRPLGYDLAGEQALLAETSVRADENPLPAIMADVWAYYDEEARLQTVRYARIYHAAPDSQTTLVQNGQAQREKE